MTVLQTLSLKYLNDLCWRHHPLALSELTTEIALQDLLIDIIYCHYFCICDHSHTLYYILYRSICA